MRRIYLETNLSVGLTESLSTDAYHYVVRVLRCRNGEKLCLFNGDGRNYHATLTLEGKRNASVLVDTAYENDNESPLHTILIQGLSKGERMDIVMQKAVELGVNEIYPVRTEFCSVKLNDERLKKKMQHWQSVMISACEQSERSIVPRLHPLQTIDEALGVIHADKKWVLHPYQVRNSAAKSASEKSSASIALLIGPEGGLSDEEVVRCIDNGFEPKSLGKRILRTETAAISALSLAQQCWGDFCVQ